MAPLGSTMSSRNTHSVRIDHFLDQLAARPDSETMFNPYRTPHGRHNLRCYLHALIKRPGRRFLLIGEALGYRGGRETGIPFSSESLLRTAPHHFLRSLRGKLELSGDSSEATASMVWAALAGRRRIPLFWNAFPFHPHHVGKPDSNRAPTGAEITATAVYLRALAELYQPHRIAGLGRKGAQAAHETFPDHAIAHLRHPSYGGKADFLRGMEQLLNR